VHTNCEILYICINFIHL